MTRFIYRFLLMGTVILLINSCRSNNTGEPSKNQRLIENDWSAANLKHNPKEIKTYIYNPQGRELPQLNNINTYYSNGFLQRSEDYKNGNLTSTKKFKMNGTRLVRINYWIQYENLEEDTYSKKLKYDKNDFLIERRNSTYPNTKSIFNYNQHGYQTRELYVNAQGHQRVVSEFYYNAYNQRIEERYYSFWGGDERFAMTLHEYNLEGQRIKTTIVDAKKRGKTVISNEYNLNGEFASTNIEMTLAGMKNSNQTKFVYVYDKHQNWIEKRFFTDDKLINVETREIKYFN